MIKSTRPTLTPIQREALEFGAKGKPIPESTNKKGGETRGYSPATIRVLDDAGYIRSTHQTRRYEITPLGRRALANFQPEPETVRAHINNRSWYINGSPVSVERASELVDAGEWVIVLDPDSFGGTSAYRRITGEFHLMFSGFGQSYYSVGTGFGRAALVTDPIHVTKRIAVLSANERELFLLLQSGTYDTGRPERQQERDRYELRNLADEGLVTADSKWGKNSAYTLTEQGIDALNYVPVAE